MLGMATQSAYCLAAFVALACLATSAAAHYCTVFCDACGDGKDPTDDCAKGARMGLFCDLGVGKFFDSHFARTDANGTFAFRTVQTVQNFKNLQGCFISLVDTQNKVCNIRVLPPTRPVLDPAYGFQLQVGETYTVSDLFFTTLTKPA
eukprot:SM004097S15675  [mRNA]  locus=s4097:654:1106:+ [translate_table: standard]